MLSTPHSRQTHINTGGGGPLLVVIATYPPLLRLYAFIGGKHAVEGRDLCSFVVLTSGMDVWFWGDEFKCTAYFPIHNGVISYWNILVLIVTTKMHYFPLFHFERCSPHCKMIP
jgi:hypothetical protein